MTLHAWRYLIPAAWQRMAGGPFRTPFIPHIGRDFFGWPLSYNDFTTGASDYDTPSDEIYCPCGETLCWDGDAGDLLRRIDGHCAKAGHPRPVRSEDV